MKKYFKYIAILLLFVLAIFLVWFFFIKKNPQIELYEQKFEDKMNAINEDVNNEEKDNKNNQPSDEEPINNDILGNNDSQIIISSDNKVLNEQGKKLLDELSKQLEDSFETISSTTGVVDDDILNKESDIKIGE